LALVVRRENVNVCFKTWRLGPRHTHTLFKYSGTTTVSIVLKANWFVSVLGGSLLDATFTNDFCCKVPRGVSNG